MPSREEILRSLTGAWRLFLDRSDAMRFFDITIDGFWRSFRAILLILPGYILVCLAERAQIFSDAVSDESFSSSAFILNRVLTLALDWVALPILLALVAGPLGLSRTYTSFVVARNWGAVLAITPFGIVALLFLIGLVGSDVANVISLAILVVVVRFNYLIARRALGADIGLAVAVVVADLAISLTILGAVDALVTYRSAAS